MILFCLFGIHIYDDLPSRATVFDREADPRRRLYRCRSCGQVKSK